MLQRHSKRAVSTCKAAQLLRGATDNGRRYGAPYRTASLGFIQRCKFVAVFPDESGDELPCVLPHSAICVSHKWLERQTCCFTKTFAFLFFLVGRLVHWRCRGGGGNGRGRARWRYYGDICSHGAPAPRGEQQVGGTVQAVWQSLFGDSREARFGEKFSNGNAKGGVSSGCTARSLTSDGMQAVRVRLPLAIRTRIPVVTELEAGNPFEARHKFPLSSTVVMLNRAVDESQASACGVVSEYKRCWVGRLRDS